jgi:hypothetical protein
MTSTRLPTSNLKSITGICRDLRSQDAIADTRLLQRTTLAGAIDVVREVYRKGAIDSGGIPVVQRIERSGGPKDKAYSKRRDTLRVEVACPSRNAVHLLAGERQRASVTAQGAVDLLVPFAHAAAPRLDRIEQHATDALAGGPSATEVLLVIAPLIAMAAGLRTSKARTPVRCRCAPGRRRRMPI